MDHEQEEEETWESDGMAPYWIQPTKRRGAKITMNESLLPPMNQKGNSPSISMSHRRRRISQESLSSSRDTLEQEEFHFVETSHPLQVLTGLNCLRLGGVFCDITLAVDGEEFPCHKTVLASFSPYFKAMFAGEMAESQLNYVALKDVDASMIRLLIEYAYTSEITITKGNVQALLSAANLWEILPVRDACGQFLERNMDESNCLGIHCFAEMHACADLKERAKEYTLKYFSDVVKQDEFLGLAQNKLIEFLSSDELDVEKEEDVLSAVLSWHHQNPDQRKVNFHKILEHVRLPLVSPYYLFDCIQEHPFLTECCECQKLINEATTYHMLHDRRSQLRSTRTRPRNSFGMTEVIVAVGGEDDKVVLRSVESFHPKTRLWATLACLPFAVSKHGLVSTGQNFLYMAGGEYPDGSVSRSLWRYDPVFDQWQEMATMNMPRSELGLVLLDGFIYAVGGWEGSFRLDSVERYDPKSNAWEYVSPLKMAVTSPAVASYGGLMYVTGGAILEDGDGINLVQCYNPKRNKWTEMAPMLIARSGSAACVLNDCIFVIGGWHASTENTSKVECYDPRKNEWTIKAPMNERRYRPGVSVVDNKIYVCGGEEGWDSYHDSIECYDDEQDKWSIVAEMPSSRSWLSCVSMMMMKDIFYGNKDKS